MGDKKMAPKGEGGDPKGKEKNHEERTKRLKKSAGRLRCPVCGAPARMRLGDRAIICRDGGHITFPDGRVEMPDGTKTSLKELKERGIIGGDEEE